MLESMSTAFRRLVLLLALAGLVLSACSGSEDAADPDPDSTVGDSGEVAPEHPLTGEELADGRTDHRVFVVKVDNTSPAAPQTGLAEADLVVEQLVEGGETRYAALYYSALPETIGHVRSLRGTDAGIAAPVQGVVVATGGAGPSIRKLQDAGVPMRLEDNDGTGFSSDPAKSRPYNRLLDLASLAADAGAHTVDGSYMTFGEELPEGVETSEVGTANVSFAGRTARTLAWRDGTWQREGGLETTDDGFAAENLIVVKAPVVDAGYRDPAGNPVPETNFVGSGDAWVAMGDQLVRATWSKDELDSTLEFTTEDGEELPVSPGRTWLMLVPDDQADPVFE